MKSESPLFSLPSTEVCGNSIFRLNYEQPAILLDYLKDIIPIMRQIIASHNAMNVEMQHTVNVILITILQSKFLHKGFKTRDIFFILIVCKHSIHLSELPIIEGEGSAHV